MIETAFLIMSKCVVWLTPPYSQHQISDCPIELLLISQIMPFIFIVGKMKVAQKELMLKCWKNKNMYKCQQSWKKNQTILLRSYDEEYLIFLALKCWLTHKSVVNKQQICLSLISPVFQKLAKINLIMSGKILLSSQNWCYGNFWQTRIPESLITDQTDNYDDTDSNGKFKEGKLKESSSPFLFCHE